MVKGRYFSLAGGRDYHIIFLFSRKKTSLLEIKSALESTSLLNIVPKEFEGCQDRDPIEKLDSFERIYVYSPYGELSAKKEGEGVLVDHYEDHDGNYYVPMYVAKLKGLHLENIKFNNEKNKVSNVFMVAAPYYKTLRDSVDIIVKGIGQKAISYISMNLKKFLLHIKENNKFRLTYYKGYPSRNPDEIQKTDGKVVSSSPFGFCDISVRQRFNKETTSLPDPKFIDLTNLELFWAIYREMRVPALLKLKYENEGARMTLSANVNGLFSSYVHKYGANLDRWAMVLKELDKRGYLSATSKEPEETK